MSPSVTDAPSKARLAVPNLLSAANISAGFVAMIAAADQRFDLAVYLLVLAVLLDLLDGRMARLLKATSRFGQEIDSFCDAVSFCAAPAFLAYQALLRPMSGSGIAISVLYLLAGVYRLVRYNLTADEHVKAIKTLGLPTPVAAGYVMALVLMRHEVSDGVAAGVIVVISLLMISRVSLPEWQGKSRVTAALAVGLASYFGVVIWPNWYTVGWWNLWNVVILLVARSDDRRTELDTATS